MGKAETLTAEQIILLKLIRSALWGEERPNNADIAMDEARKQALVSLLFPDSPEAMRYSAHYIRILYAQDELVQLMKASKIPMVVLKGSAAAIYYPDPFLRTMGDIDFIVPQSQFETACALLPKIGYHLVKDLDFVGRHRCYQKDGIEVELHHHYSYDDFDIEKYVTSGIENSDVIELSGHLVPILPQMENGMVLLSHVAGHLRSEIGLRQVLDWMMYVDKVADDRFWAEHLCSAATECGLQTLAIVMTRMCQVYLGLRDSITWADSADLTLCDELLRNLLITGNFGNANGAGTGIETVATNIRRNGLFFTLQNAGEHNWKAYQKHKVLKPLCWAYQIGRYIHRGLGTGRSGLQLAEDYNRSQARYDLLTRLGID